MLPLDDNSAIVTSFDYELFRLELLDVEGDLEASQNKIFMNTNA